MDYGHFWWNNVHGPMAAADSVAKSIIDGKSVLALFDETLPWADIMQERIRGRIERQGDGSDIIDIDAAEELTTPVSYLIDRFTDGVGYRPHKGRPWEYLRDTKALNGIILWVHNIPREQFASWNELCRGLKGSCRMLLEAGGAYDGELGAEAVHVARCFSEYDYLMFASLVASERTGLTDMWRRYLSDLAAVAFAYDVKEIADFIMNFNTEEQPDLPPAVIWRVQLRNCFHMLEMMRRGFISKYEQDIMACLPELQFNKLITDPFDAETGTLIWLTKSKRDEEGKRRLFVASVEDYEQLHSIANMRNKLAHGYVLTPGELAWLFGAGQC
jgi:hypothetical protein